MPEVIANVLPVYMVADESGSMKNCMAQLNDGLASLHATLYNEPFLAAKVRLSILGFAQNVIVRLDRADLRRASRIPQLVLRDATNYSAVFEDLLVRIPIDVALLKLQGFRVYRPVVFFLTDGMPTDGSAWRMRYATLVDRAATPVGPHIVSFGIGNANPATIREIATRKDYAFMAVQGSDAGAAIADFCRAFTQSLVGSARAMAGGMPELVIERPESFRFINDIV